MPDHTVHCRLLNLLTWRIGCLLLCGFSALTSTFPFVSTFEQLPVGRRELVLQSWATSSIPQFRKVCLSPFLTACLQEHSKTLLLCLTPLWLKQFALDAVACHSLPQIRCAALKTEVS